jgi:hypothetical protein
VAQWRLIRARPVGRCGSPAVAADSMGVGVGDDSPCGGRLVASGAQNQSGDGERRLWSETRGEAKLGAQTRGFGAENECRENGGAQGAIYRGQVGHRRGAWRNKGRHEWRLSTRALGERKGMGRHRLLKGKRRGGQAAPMLMQRSWPEVNDRRRAPRISYGGGSFAQRGRKRRRFQRLRFRIEETEAS